MAVAYYRRTIAHQGEIQSLSGSKSRVNSALLYITGIQDAADTAFNTSFLIPENPQRTFLLIQNRGVDALYVGINGGIGGFQLQKDGSIQFDKDFPYSGAVDIGLVTAGGTHRVTFVESSFEG